MMSLRLVGGRGFEKFNRKSGIHNVVMYGEAASSNKDEAADLVNKFSAFVNTERYVAQQVFNYDETGLFLEKVPRRTYITKEEKSVPGHKSMKDKLTLLLCANASGDCLFTTQKIHVCLKPTM